MNACPDTATLAALESAAHWTGLDTVDHIAGCAACRADLTTLEGLHDSIPEVRPDAALTGNVLRAVREDQPARTRLRSLAALPAVAVSAWLVLAFGWSATGQPDMPPASTVALALLAGTALTLRSHVGSIALTWPPGSREH